MFVNEKYLTKTKRFAGDIKYRFFLYFLHTYFLYKAFVENHCTWIISETLREIMFYL